MSERTPPAKARGKQRTLSHSPLDGWLIEYQAPDGARWLHIGKNLNTEFLPASHTAIKFQDRESAQRMLDYLREIHAFASNDGLSVTDHIWL